MPTRSCPENHQWPISNQLSITTQKLCPAGQNHPLSAVYQHQSWQLLLPLLTINLHSSCPHCPEHFLLPDPVLATQNLPGRLQTSRPPPHLYLCYSSTVSGVFGLPATPRLNHSLLRPKLQLPGCNQPLRGSWSHSWHSQIYLKFGPPYPPAHPKSRSDHNSIHLPTTRSDPADRLCEPVRSTPISPTILGFSHPDWVGPPGIWKLNCVCQATMGWASLATHKHILNRI